MYPPGQRPTTIDKKFSLSEVKIDSMDDYMARIGEPYDSFDLQEYMVQNLESSIKQSKKMNQKPIKL